MLAKDNHKEFESALKVNDGIEQPPSVNVHAVSRFRRSRHPELSVEEYVNEIRQGNRAILSKAITLIESSLEAHQQKAQDIIS
ncbi:MAG TPA: methylmalonyl Co-A mutase-associated GTPase MeaB, partial [Bacteroidales bacterium]